MDPTTVPVFDLHTPWVALIQIVLFYLLPRIVGRISDKWAASLAKTAALGTLSIIGSGLTWLLDVAVSNTWSLVNWNDLITILVNGVITWVVANRVFDQIIKPSGQAAVDAEKGFSFIGPSEARVDTVIADSNLTAKQAKEFKAAALGNKAVG